VAGKVKVGVLALQGAVEPHLRSLAKVGAEPVEVRKPEHLKGLSGIVLPGGESTSMIHLLKVNSLWAPLKEFVSVKPSFGVCAGAILLSKRVSHPVQDSLGALDVSIERNAFGRQSDSFVAIVEPTDAWQGEGVEGVFIRAPRFRDLGAAVTPLFCFKNEPVLVQQGKILAGSFHPELTPSLVIHHFFVTHCQSEETPWMTDFQNPYASLSVN
jgi:pyridoxal 5'-phosphate synthase pdxT subunit